MKFQKDFILPSLTPQPAILGLYNEANGNYNLLSHILLIFKCHIYISREKRTLNYGILTANLIKVKKREKQISIATINKREAYKKKWCITDNILPFTLNNTSWKAHWVGGKEIFCSLYLFVCYFFNYLFV